MKPNRHLGRYGFLIVVILALWGCQTTTSSHLRVKGVAAVKKQLVSQVTWVRNKRVAQTRAQPAVRPGVSSGCLSKEPIRREMKRLHPDFVRCINQAQGRLCQAPWWNHSMRGRYKFSLRYKINPRGLVDQVLILADRPAESRLLHCLGQVTSQAQFPTFGRRSWIQVSYPVHAILAGPNTPTCSP